MRFTSPLWLAAGLSVCLALCLLWYRYDRRQRADLAKVVSLSLQRSLTASVSVARRRLRRALLACAVACLFAALAGPQWGYRWEEITRRGNDIVFAIDTSRSMLTQDLKPDRLTRAKLAVDDVVGPLDGDAIGIVAFSGTSFLACPITLDYAAFHETLNAIDTRTLPRGGTNISSAIALAQAALRRRPGDDKIMILLTDGEDLEGDALAAAKAAAAQDRIRIFTIGIGTPAGELIPLPADQGGGYVNDEKGVPVRSRLDEAALKAIAAATGASYVSLGEQSDGLGEGFRNALSAIARHDLASRRQKIYTERFQWPLGASLASLLASLMLGSRRARARTSASARASVAGRTAAAVALLAATLPGGAPRAATDDIREPAQQYNAGTADYRAGRFPEATQAFQQSISQAPSSDPKRLRAQQDAYYNLGNTLYRSGQKTLQSAPQTTRQRWADAIKAYETALQLRPDDADSQYNRDLVKRKLDELNKDPPPPSGSPPSAPPPPGQPPPGQPPPGQPPPQGKPPAEQAPAAEHRAAGQMSQDEAQQLLDSAKGEEHAGLKAPIERRNPDQPPEKPFKDW